MKWNEIFRTRKLLKRLISMSLCIGMAGGQLLSGIPIQAEEQTDESTYALPTDTKINPNITIQHYYHFPNMDLGNVEEDFKKATGLEYSTDSSVTRLKQYLSAKDSFSNIIKPVVVWNTSIRGGKLPDNVPSNYSYAQKRELDPKSTIQFENDGMDASGSSLKFGDQDGTIKIKERLYKLFEDEPVKYLTKPQMRYMNKLYNGSANASAYNANYSLKEVWLKNDSNDKDSIEETGFLVLQAPQMEVDGIMRHDPSKFIFTNNENNANLTKKEKNIRYGEDLNTGKKTVLVTEGMVIRLVFEPTTGTTDIQDVDFFDYDISDGWIYTSQDAAKAVAEGTSPDNIPTFETADALEAEYKTNANPYGKTYTSFQSDPKFANKHFWAVTNKKGINSSATVFAFGNSNTKTGLGDNKWTDPKNGTINELNKSNTINRFNTSTDGSNLQGATFNLVENKLTTNPDKTDPDNKDVNLQWSEGVAAPDIFSLNEAPGKTIYKGVDEKKLEEGVSIPENYSLNFNRVGGTYTLSGVTRDDNNTKLSNLDKLPSCKNESVPANKLLRTNEFWPMDLSSSYGTNGHDLKFGNYNSKGNRTAYGVGSENFPESDSGLDHNAYFGMKTQIPFVLEDGYCAPLRYFFYGDDDLYVFLSKTDNHGNIIEGTTKKVVDLGGVHSSYGMFVNLWDFIDDKTDKPIATQKNEDGTEEEIYAFKKKSATTNSRADENETENSADTKQNYVLSIFYTERGASGSSCYMRFSVPFEGLSIDEAAMNGQVQVDKEVKHSLLNSDTEDEYVFQLELEAPDGTELNNQYAIEFFTLSKDDQGNTKETKIVDKEHPMYIAPNGTFKLKDNQRARISGLPRSGPKEDLVGSKHEGYYYKVSELGRYNSTPGYVNPKYKDSGDDNLIHLEELSPTTSTTFRKGSVDKGLDQNYQEGTSFDNLIKEENYVQFINAEDPGTITLRKELTETGGSQTEEFTFNVTLTKDGSPITKVSSLLNITEGEKIKQEREEFERKDGKYSVTVAPNQERILYNIPLGTQYEISEVEKKDEQGGKYEVDSIKITGNHTHNDSVTDLNLVRGTLDSVNGTKPAIEATFVNEYHKIAEVNIPVQKFVTGEAFASDESYTFEITPVTEGAPIPEKTQINVAPGNGMATIAAENVYDANGQFGPIVFDDTMDPGKYTYTIREIAGEDTDIQYDSHEYNVVVTATKDESGNVNAHITSIDNDPVNDEPSVNLEFTNDKVAPIDLSIPVEKNLVGRNVEKNDSFTFRISEDETHDNPKRLSNLISDRSLTIEPDTNNELKGEFILSKFTLEDVGKEYWFVLEEQKGDIKQLDYDTSKITVKVTFTLTGPENESENGPKTIVPVIQRVEGENSTIDANNPVVFTNTYHAIGQIEIPVEKTLINKEFGNETYRFEISNPAGKADQPLPSNTVLEISKADADTPENDHAGGTFEIPLTDKEVPSGGNKQFTYEIHEIAGTDPNMVYDSNTYTVTVNATNTAGTITSEIAAGSQSVSITNTNYVPADTIIPIRKVLNGREIKADDTFTFRIRGDAQSRKFILDNDEIKISAQVIDGKLVLQDNSFKVGSFSKEDAGTPFNFTITEESGNEKGMNYDSAVHTVTVTPRIAGSLILFDVKEGEAKITDSKPLIFTNTYQPTGTLEIPVKKTLKGRSFTNGDRFLFEITGEKGAPLPAQTILYVLPTAGDSINSSFGPITYTEDNVGDYTYTVKEIATGLSGMQYDTKQYTVNVNVKKENGTIQVTRNFTLNEQPADAIVFENVYKPEAQYAIRVTKTMTGRTMTAADQFVFTLEAVTEDAPMPEHNQVTVQGNGKNEVSTNFDPIVYTKDHAGKTYQYKVKEHRGSIEHIKYSTEEYLVSVSVTNTNGKLEVSPSIQKQTSEGTNDVGSIQFTNVYQPSGTWRPTVYKQLLGARLEDGAYTFEMHVEKQDEPAVSFERKAANSADGSINFELIEFEKTGRYNVTISEVKGNDDTIQYASEPIEYTVEVKDENGILQVEELNRQQDHVFTNDAGLRISKQLIPGTNQTLEAKDLNNEFQFELDLGSVLANQTLDARRITQDQRKVEENIKLDQTGKATFALKHNETLIVYGIGQNTPYRVQEITQDRWTGNYLFIDTIGSASGTMSDGIDAEVTFRNLKPSEDKANIHGFKTMAPDGDPFEMKGGEFEFRISAFDSTPTVRQDNEPIEPQQEILDESFEIHRSELPDESLETPVEDSETEEAENNGSAPADAQKKMKLPLLIKEAETVPAQETPLPEKTTVTNNAYGRFDFGDIVYRQPGRYVYKVEEINNQIPGMDYDETFYKVVVTVSQISGSLHVDSIEYMDRDDKPATNGTILFANKYTNEQDKPALSIHKEQSVNFEDYSDSPESVAVNANDLVTYRLTIRNDGTATAKNVVVTDKVPAGLILIEQSLSDAQVDAQGTITWSIGDLGANASRTLTFQVRVPKVESMTKWTNAASVGSDNTDPHDSNEVTIESEPAKPDVTIRKYESTPQSGRYDGTESLEVKSGELVTYDMIVTNSGNEDATNVEVTDEVPDGLEFVQAFDGGSYDKEKRMITWNVGTLAANGGTAIVSFQIRVPVVDKDKGWSNFASLKYDGEEPKNSNEVKINTIVKNLEIEKLQAVNHGPLTKDLQAVKAGDVVTYALHITNPGDHTIDNASVRDTVPDGLELITDSISDGGTYNSQTHEIIWNLGKVDAKHEKQVTFSVKVPKVDQKTSWKNIATLIYDNEKPKDSNEVVVGTDLPNLTIVKDQKLAADPDYTFEKRTGQTGDTLTYRLTVTNTGTATAKDVVIEDTIPTAELMETPLFLRFVSASDNGEFNERTQTITWSIGDVAPGQSKSVTFTVTIPGVKQNTLWINKAYTHYENNPDNPSEGEPKDIPSNEVKVDTMVPAVILEKEHKLNDGDRVTSLLHGNAQDTVTYYLKATNTSMATAHDVWIKDTIPTHENGALVLKEVDETYAHELNEETGEIVWKIGDLAPGEEKEVWFSVTVPEVQEATRWRNIASVSHQEDPTVPREEIETPPVEVEVLVPELEIVKRQAKNDGSLTQGLIQANAGDTITYAIEVTNTGTGPAQNIVVEDIVPEGLELVNGSISDQGQNRGGKITWNMASLEAGKAKTFTFKVKIPSVKEYTLWANVATVSDEDDPDPKPTPPVEVETEAPHLTVEKSQKRNEGNRTKDKLSVVGKDRVTYFIKVTNDGQADAKDVVVSDVVPEGLILVDGSVSDSGLVEKGVISWQLGTLAAGASRTVSFAVDVPESEGVWKNIAEAIESTHPKEPTPSNEVEIETPKEEPNITIEKLQAQNDAQPSKTRIKARVDDTITYVLRVQNRGKETVRDIVVKDAIPQGLRFVSGSISKEGTIENGVMSWKIEELAPDQIVDLTFQVKVPVVTRNSAWINIGVLIHDDKQTPSNEVTVSIEPETPASSKNGKPTSPNTAAETNHMIWLGALMISVLVLAVLWKRKKNISH